MILKTLYFIAVAYVILLILIGCDYVSIFTGKTPLLGAIGIVLSAFIASFSVKQSIENTNKLESIKNRRKLKSLLVHIALIATKIKDYQNDINKLDSRKDYMLIFKWSKQLIEYLTSIEISLVRENYVEYIEEEEYFFVLTEIISDIQHLNYYINILDDIEANENEELNESINFRIKLLEERSRALLQYCNKNI